MASDATLSPLQQHFWAHIFHCRRPLDPFQFGPSSCPPNPFRVCSITNVPWNPFSRCDYEPISCLKAALRSTAHSVFVLRSSAHSPKSIYSQHSCSADMDLVLFLCAPQRQIISCAPYAKVQYLIASAPQRFKSFARRLNSYCQTKSLRLTHSA